ncbi:unnamed protein product, partial [Urochloa humidicola]
FSYSSSDHTAAVLFRLSEQEATKRGLQDQRSRQTATMLEGKARVEDTDMPAKMQAQAMEAASRALDRFDVLDCRSIAAHIKKEFDTIYGAGWQCVVGSSFGCYFTHSKGTFIYFRLE